MSDKLLQLPAALSGLPRLDQYVGLWAIAEEPFRAAIRLVEAADLGQHVAVRRAAPPEQASDPPYANIDGVALLDVTGIMTKYGSSFAQMQEGTLGRRRALRAAVADPDVRAILLRIDSPGGAVAGSGDLADDVAAAAAKKPLWAYIEDVGASAAYWVASQAQRISINPSAAVGSVGVYMVVRDLSAAAKAEGVKVHVIRAGAYKGAGEPGTPITDEQLAEFQRGVDDVSAVMVGAIARGRRMPYKQAQGLADGRIHIGAAAVSAGLADQVESLEQAVAALRRQMVTLGPARAAAVARGDLPMSEANGPTKVDAAAPSSQPPASRPASLGELRAAFPQSDAAFREQCIEAGATMDQARERWQAKREAELDQREKALAAREKAAAAKPQPAAIGVQPAPQGEGDAPASPAASPRAAFDALVAENMKARGMTRSKAVSTAVREHPEVHAAAVVAHNSERNRPLGRFA